MRTYSSFADEMQLLDYDSAISTATHRVVAERETVDMMDVELSYAGLLHHIFRLQAALDTRLQNSSGSPLEIGDILNSGRQRLHQWRNSISSRVQVHDHDTSTGKDTRTNLGPG